MTRPAFPLPQITLATAMLLVSCTLLSQPGEVRVQNPELDELSGLAASYAEPGLLWAHNDSGDTPRLFRIGADGADLGSLPVPGAKAGDWEDMAAFDWRGQPALLIADVGDNTGSRARPTLYAVSDPGATGDSITLLWRMTIRYPDGPRDCEAVAVDPIDQAVILLSKREHPQHLYRVALPKKLPLDGAIVTAELLGTVHTLPRSNFSDLFSNPLYSQFDGPTALDIARSGRFAVVTTYRNAFLYRRDEGQSWIDAFAALPETIPLPPLKQTEAGAISVDGTRFTISGEGRHPPLASVPLPPPAPAPAPPPAPP